MEDQIEQLRESAKEHGMSEAFVEWFISKRLIPAGALTSLLCPLCGKVGKVL
ncbi:Hypothetical protein TB34TRB_258 [Escherichia phage vB_Eco_TB34]|nr:Hypothetical protein TB34TRB_258 [Escherichia phage vB_Eco_TB34]